MGDAPRYCSTCLKRFNERSWARVYKSEERFFLAYFYLSLLQYILSKEYENVIFCSNNSRVRNDERRFHGWNCAFLQITAHSRAKVTRAELFRCGSTASCRLLNHRAMSFSRKRPFFIPQQGRYTERVFIRINYAAIRSNSSRKLTTPQGIAVSFSQQTWTCSFSYSSVIQSWPRVFRRTLEKRRTT